MAVRKRRNDEPVSRDNVIEAPIVQRQMTVSDVLRGRRIECGLDIPHVAEVLRIRPTVLTAIEDGNFDLMPGPVYAIGFVRSYAAYLGLDAENLVARFKAEAAEVSNRPHLHFPLPIRDSRVPTGPLLVICVLLAVLTYAGWYYFNAKPGRFADIVPNVPERMRQMLEPPPRVLQAPRPAVSAAPTPTDDARSEPVAANATNAAPAPATPAEPNGAQIGQAQIGQASQGPTVAGAESPAAVDGVPPVETGPPIAPGTSAGPVTPSPSAAPDLAQPAPVAATPDQPPQPPTAYGAPEGQSRVVLRANANCWIQVRDKAGNLLFTRMLKPGEHYNAPNVEGLTLIAGNAGGLDVTVDGTAAPRIGELGQVARNVSLDPEHLLAGEAHAN